MDFGGSSVDLPVDAKFLPTELRDKVFAPNQFNEHILTNNGGDIGANGDMLDFAPRVVVVEQPQQRGFRFRYECEGPSHGGLQGEKSEKGRRSYPTIKIENHRGPAKVVVRLVTDEPAPRPHAHKLVGKNCQNGICVTELKTGNTISFPNLSILHVTRRKAAEVLEERFLETMRMDKTAQLNMPYALTKEDRDQAKKKAQEATKNMQLNVVRLCFQVYLQDDSNEFTQALPAVYSNTIFDSKSPGASALKICRMDKYGGCCTGNEEVFLLCEKVQKDDVAVKFVEQDKEGNIVWESHGNFGPLDVHRQYAIVFKTPPYWNTSINRAVNVLIMLERKTDGEVSEPKAFTYFPQNNDIECIARKKRKKIPLDGSGYNFFGNGGNGFGGAGAGGGGGTAGGGGLGGGGGMGGSAPYRVILPNGSVVSQSGNLPSTVEQVVNEEFMNAPSPSSSESLEFDLETDEPVVISSRHHPVVRFSEADLPAKSATRPGADAVSVLTEELDNISLNKEAEAADDDEKSSTEKAEKEEAEEEKEEGEAEKEEAENQDKDSLASGEPERKTGKGSGKGPQQGSPKKEPAPGAESVLESCRTDEGFSECSEESAAREDSRSKTRRVRSQQEPVPEWNPRSRRSGRRYYVDAQRLTETTAFALQEFAETGDVRHILKIQRHLLSVKNENGDLPIHLAVINNQPGALQSILDVMCTLPNARQRVNTYNYLLQTALHLAVLTQQPAMIDMLLQAGADPALTDRHGNTPAHLAVQLCAETCLAMLLRYLRPGVTETNPFPELNFLNYEGYTPAHQAAQRGSVELLKLLVRGVADINLPDGKSGRTPLHHAVEADDLPVAGFLLLEAQADVNARCYDGNTPLHIACGRGLVGMVALLVTAEADPEAENEEIPDAEEEGEELPSGCTQHSGRGLKPADYAQDNPRILRVLRGEVYQAGSSSGSSHSEEEADLQEDGPHSLTRRDPELPPLTRLPESGLCSIPSSTCGDMDKLGFLTRLELSRLLDPPRVGQDVYALAAKLGYPNLVTAMQSSTQHGMSATRLLLDFFEASEGTVKTLKDCLQSINRDDAIAKIDTDLTSSVESVRQATTQSHMDSGLESMTSGLKSHRSSAS